jgi:ABC-type transport system involved in multi-copper enzyme maturation permease subunit
VQRLLALIALLVAGMLSLPLAALGFDGEGSENWILPVQLGGMAALGGLAGLTVPGLVREGSSARRRFFLGAALGIGMAAVGVLVFFWILSGFDGA